LPRWQCARARGDGFGLVAGEQATAESVSDVVSAICPRTCYMGAFGNGAKAKLAINLILGLNRAALAEGLVFASRLGLPLEAFLDAAKGSAAYSQIMDVKGGKMIARDFSPHGKVGQSAKDFGLILDAAASRGQALPLAEVYANLMAGCVAAGEAEFDNCAVIEEIGRRGKPGPA
jgi:3-hydroxyisobutyrate dehydrogenase-like beta-hydroxyacid dehydrogenase